MANIPKVWNGSSWIEVEAAPTVAPAASTSVVGIVQLTDSTSSTSTTTAATPNSVKSAYDLATAAVPKSTLAAKGDLIVASAAGTPAALTAGTDGHVLTADSTATNGIKWAAASSGGYNLTQGGHNISGGVDLLNTTGTEYAHAAGNTTVRFYSTWDASSASSTFTAANTAYAVGYGNGVYLVGGANGNIQTSTDKSSWTTRTSGFSTSAIHGFAYGNVSGTHTYVAAGESGKISSSTDSGATWTARTSGFSTTQIDTVRYVNGNFVAVGYDGKISTSTDGSTWTLQTTPSATPALYEVAYGNGTYVAVGDNAAIWTSTNLTSWTARTTPTNLSGTNNFVGAVYGNGIWMVMSKDGRILTSTDAITWTESLHRFSGLMITTNLFRSYGKYDNGYIWSIHRLLNLTNAPAAIAIKLT